MTIERSQLTWSKLTPTPVCAYHVRSDAHLVYWNGVAMVRASALIITASVWGLSYPSPKMHASAYEEFKRACMLEAFGKVKWRSTELSDARSYHMRLTKWINKENSRFLKDLESGYSLREALEWFHSENETQIHD